MTDGTAKAKDVQLVKAKLQFALEMVDHYQGLLADYQRQSAQLRLQLSEMTQDTSYILVN